MRSMCYSKKEKAVEGFERSKELEEADFLNAILAIKQAEKRVTCPNVKITPWGADELRLLLVSDTVKMSTRFGTSIIITAIPKYENDRYPVFEPQHLVEIQFLAQSQLEKIFQSIQVFSEKPESAMLKMSFIQSKEADPIRNYCKTMDQVIIKESKALQFRGITGIFQKLYDRLTQGGVEDPIAKRIYFFRELLQKYKENPSLFKPEYTRVFNAG